MSFHDEVIKKTQAKGLFFQKNPAEKYPLKSIFQQLRLFLRFCLVRLNQLTIYPDFYVLLFQVQ